MGENVDKSGQNSVPPTVLPPPCNGLCPHCCGGEESARLMQIEGDLAMRNRGLTLSSTLVCGIVIAQIVFAYMGKTLNLPGMEYIWAMVVFPWFGAAGAKVAEIIIEKRKA